MRSIRILVAVFVVARRLHQLHARPVRIEFIGDDTRESRPAPASHLRAMRDDVGGFRPYRLPGTRLAATLLSSCHPMPLHSRRAKQLFRHHSNAENECSGSEHALEESPPGW